MLNQLPLIFFFAAQVVREKPFDFNRAAVADGALVWAAAMRVKS